MPGPAATIGSMHVCPMLNPGTPPPPHVGGPVSGPGIPTVLIGGKPAAVMGDMCVCAGPPDTIAQGEATVLIGGKPAATLGSMTAHGGSITVGEPTVLIGTGGSGATAVIAATKIPFPKINFALKTMASLSGRGSQLSEAAANQQALRETAENTEGDPKIYGVQWIVGDQTVRASKVFNEVTIRANVLNIPDGESITFSVKKPTSITNTEGETVDNEEDIIELTGTVQDKMVQVDWEIEKATEEEGSEDEGSSEENGVVTASSNEGTNSEEIENTQKIDVIVEYKKGKFIALGLEAFGNKEQNFLNFKYDVLNRDAESLDLEILANSTVIYRESITDSSDPKLKLGKHEWQWDGFDNQDKISTEQLKKEQLQFKVTANANGEKVGKSVSFGPLRPTKIKWIEASINRATKKINIDLRVNLKDGGSKGTEKGHKVNPAAISHYGFQPITETTKKTFTDLEALVLDGLHKHWSRNVIINNDTYSVTVNAVNTPVNSMDDVDLKYNTNSAVKGSSNPGTVEGVVSFVANVIAPEVITYNGGYITTPNTPSGWVYVDPAGADDKYRYLGAHEIGHTLLKACKGTIKSYKHNDSSTIFQKTKKGKKGISYPVNPPDEIDVMKYYQNEPYFMDYTRVKANEEDVIGLLSIIKMK